MDNAPELPVSAFEKWDTGDDADFYVQPRFVTHIDNAAIAALTAFYREVLPAGGVILDLMSSWVSHLPPEVSYAEVIGHGMNEAELTANSRLGRRFVQDFNRNQQLPLEDSSVDAATICVSIQYLQHPVEVLREVARVLKPGKPLIIGFSNRCFPTKAVAIWQSLDGTGHAQLVTLYMKLAGFEGMETKVLCDGHASDPFIVVLGRRAF
ncbi:MAG: methyltransferase domain-containing protein [Rhodospirillaceae bacterium]|nr:MAG: methyltransferase domain-containing protein [Rhodospirillaceae bacterium]